jgi:hypothetical protein
MTDEKRERGWVFGIDGLRAERELGSSLVVWRDLIQSNHTFTRHWEQA